jgi:hypothetical protein
MNEKDFTKAVATNIGEVVASFMAIINVMRNQKNFDDAAFKKDIKKLLNSSEMAGLQKEILSRMID